MKCIGVRATLLPGGGGGVSHLPKKLSKYTKLSRNDTRVTNGA